MALLRSAPALHAGHDSDPLTEVYFPTSQSMHDVLSASEYWPGAQAMQAAAPLSVPYFPGGHVLHRSCITSSWYLAIPHSISSPPKQEKPILHIRIS